MTRMLRLPVLAVLLVVLASGVALQAAASPPNHANRFEATFDESTASVTNRIADLGVFQLINTGTGTVEGFGEATLVMSATQDRTVQPCGPGSWTNSTIRRIVLADGVLVLRVPGMSVRRPPARRSPAPGRSTAPRAPGSSPAHGAAATRRSTSRTRGPRSHLKLVGSEG